MWKWYTVAMVDNEMKNAEIVETFDDVSLFINFDLQSMSSNVHQGLHIPD